MKRGQRALRERSENPDSLRRAPTEHPKNIQRGQKAFREQSRMPESTQRELRELRECDCAGAVIDYPTRTLSHPQFSVITVGCDVG